MEKRGKGCDIILPSFLSIHKPTLHIMTYTHTHITTNLPWYITTAQIYLYVVTQVWKGNFCTVHRLYWEDRKENQKMHFFLDYTSTYLWMSFPFTFLQHLITFQINFWIRWQILNRTIQKRTKDFALSLLRLCA